MVPADIQKAVDGFVAQIRGVLSDGRITLAEAYLLVTVFGSFLFTAVDTVRSATPAQTKALILLGWDYLWSTFLVKLDFPGPFDSITKPIVKYVLDIGLAVAVDSLLANGPSLPAADVPPAVDAVAPTVDAGTGYSRFPLLRRAVARIVD